MKNLTIESNPETPYWTGFPLLLTLISVLFFSFFSVQGQDRKIDLKWLEPAHEQGIKLRLRFEGASFNPTESALPWYEIQLPGTAVQYKIADPIYQELTLEETTADLSEVTPTPQISNHKITERKTSRTLVKVLPFRMNSLSGKIEKLSSFRLVQDGALKVGTAGVTARVYATNSVLSTGDWYKVSVINDGIYKVTYEYLNTMGVQLNNVSTQALRLFGNGGGMVPTLNSISRPDDLLENAIQVVDQNNDGLFNAGDYFIFYGQGPDRWTYSTNESKYLHQKHLFSDSTYYYITINGGTGSAKRISQISNLPSGSGDRLVGSFTDYNFHEEDKQNFIKSGRNWYGELFDVVLNQKFTFTFPNLVAGSVKIKSGVAARTSTNTSSTSRFNVSYNGTNILTHIIGNVGTNYTDDFARTGGGSAVFQATGDNIELNYTFVPYNSQSSGWLDFVSLNATRQLAMSGNQLIFRDLDTLNTVSQSRYTISNARSGLMLWNISDAENVAAQDYILNGSQAEFVRPLDAGGKSEYVFFDPSSYKIPIADGKVFNQNLHALPLADMLIVSYPDFLGEAERLAEFHRSNDGLRVNVVSTDQVYNEFSCGTADISAIRDFAKMFYDRAGANTADLPRYLLLFGDGSYDNKNRIAGNTNYIPTFQSENSVSLIGSYVTDDFFGMMDDTEGSLVGPELIDIGVGRLVAKTEDEARNMVDKVITYSTAGVASNQNNCTQGNGSRLGDWRNILCFIADDQDSNLHFRQSETILGTVQATHPVYNFDKIVLDAYQQVSTPGGARYPDVNDAIDKRVNKGAFLVNYTGHGGELGWAAEGVLSTSMINNWNNLDNMPFFITATCEFSRYDDPLRTSAGELVLLNKNGGGIALLTTVRLAFAADNQLINTDILQYMFQPINGEMPRIGDIFRLSKRDNPSLRNVTLLGDPALRLAYPKYNVQTLAIEETGTGIVIDTLSALSKVTIRGKVTDNAGTTLTGFNGVVYPTIYDKTSKIMTLANDNTGNDQSKVDSFNLRKNILFKGKASVSNGEFTCSFIVPKDIAFQYGSGRLSYYANNGSEDANGYDESFDIGGSSNNVITDNKGPEIKLYMNDEKFVFGGLTDDQPKIFALLFDSSGINTVGNGIGHDLTAQVDGKAQKLYVLNDYYESDLDSYQKGRVLYSLEKLSEGRHTLTLKAWDINNNSAESFTEFVVSSSAGLALDHVLNYPNPFSTHTSFMFEHNKPCTGMAIQVQVFTVSGKLVKTLDTYQVCEGYRNTTLDWDGKDDYGDQLAKGVYIYKLRIRTAEGETAQKLERLVILR